MTYVNIIVCGIRWTSYMGKMYRPILDYCMEEEPGSVERRWSCRILWFYRFYVKVTLVVSWIILARNCALRFSAVDYVRHEVWPWVVQLCCWNRGWRGKRSSVFRVLWVNVVCPVLFQYYWFVWFSHLRAHAIPNNLFASIRLSVSWIVFVGSCTLKILTLLVGSPSVLQLDYSRQSNKTAASTCFAIKIEPNLKQRKKRKTKRRKKTNYGCLVNFLHN